MRLKRTGFQFRMVLHADKPRMIRIFDRFRQNAVRRHASEIQAGCFETVLIVDIDFITMAVTLVDIGRAVDLRNLRVGLQHRFISAKAHRTAKIARRRTLFKHIALQPFGHETHDRLPGWAKLA